MSSEFDSTEEVKDRTKWLWIGLALLVVVLLGAVWMWGRANPDMSYVRARHILISFDPKDPADRARARTTIEELREKVLAGEDFGKLAKEHSNDQFSSVRGGDLNYMRKGEMVPEMEEFAWNGPINEVSDVIATQFGFHIVIITERHLSRADRYEVELKQKAMESSPAEANR